LTWEGYFGIIAALSSGIETFFALEISFFAMPQLEIAPENAATDPLDLE